MGVSVLAGRAFMPVWLVRLPWVRRKGSQFCPLPEGWGMLLCALGTLAKWLLSTRLETRTKESNMCASARGLTPQRVMKVNASLAR